MVPEKRRRSCISCNPNDATLVQLRHLLRVGVLVIVIAGIGLSPLRWKNAIGTTGVLHFPLHILAFAAASAAAAGAVRSTAGRTFAAALVWIFGILLEYLQHALYFNPFEWLDVVTNSIGVVLGLLIAISFASRRQKALR